MRVVPPGDDVCPVPPPVDEVPPYDQFCDLVMTGGVASGVVYPWAVVEIARAFRFRNIGGTSVGAMAAALAAAGEYGRRVGFDDSFEALRRTPAALGEMLPDGRTRMLSLFQANERGRRLVRLWGRLGRGGLAPKKEDGKVASARQRVPPAVRVAGEVACAYRWPLGVGALAGGLILGAGCGSIVARLILALVGSLAGFGWALWGDIRHGVIENCLGLCKGGTLEPADQDDKRPALSEWLHQGIQAGAGLKAKDSPLTFRDLWCAPFTPGDPHLPCDEDDPQDRRSINLQMITTNVTHGRPYRLPLSDEATRLFYKPADLAHYFPPVVLAALDAVSRRYEPQSESDPASIDDSEAFRELPGADMPVVVAARLSLSYPLLFAAVPLWAIDYEAERGKRGALRRCLFTDGGASSNFPIHLFDAAMPRWPTFGLWLDLKDPNRPKRKDGQDPDVWLPDQNREGWGDSWRRFDPEADGRPAGASRVSQDTGVARFSLLAGFLLAIATGAMDWHDRTSMRLPHVRNRVARLFLGPGEGGLNIGMSREQILDMAHRYGTKAGKLFVQRYADADHAVSPAWSEHRWIRLVVLINGLRERLKGLAAAADWAAHSVPIADAVQHAVLVSPIRDEDKWTGLGLQDARSLAAQLAELESLEAILRPIDSPSFQPVPTPEMRLRAPL